MQAGIYTNTFIYPTLEEVLEATQRHGFAFIQFDLEAAGLPMLPERIEPGICDRIRTGMLQRGIRLEAIGGTFNMIDPDLAKRRNGLARLGVLASACPRLGTRIITLCTGTRDPVSMWRPHRDNSSPEAWRDLVASMSEAVRFADLAQVTLALEPEVSNVVDSALKARRLLDEVKSPWLKVVIDGANLFHLGELPKMNDILDQAFDLLGPDIVLAHAKDLDHDGEAGHLPAGMGRLNYDRYVSLLESIGYDGGLILHGLTEAQIPACKEFLRGKLAALAGKHEGDPGTKRGAKQGGVS